MSLSLVVLYFQIFESGKDKDVKYSLDLILQDILAVLCNKNYKDSKPLSISKCV
jgi:hypothetical protein